jgi:hypothetical protein
MIQKLLKKLTSVISKFYCFSHFITKITNTISTYDHKLHSSPSRKLHIILCHLHIFLISPSTRSLLEKLFFFFAGNLFLRHFALRLVKKRILAFSSTMWRMMEEVFILLSWLCVQNVVQIALENVVEGLICETMNIQRGKRLLTWFKDQIKREKSKVRWFRLNRDRWMRFRKF